jgi:alkyldihydroxyacetonephosphate synthase
MHSGTQERRRKFYGWGDEGDEVSPQEIAEFEKAWTRLIGVSDFTAVPFPTEDSINLRSSRVKVPGALEAICTTDKYDRLYHTLRRVYCRRGLLGTWRIQEPPGRGRLSAHRRRYRQAIPLVRNNSLAAIPYGGGTSVVGGVNPPEHDRYHGALSIDMKYFNKVLEIDHASQAARIQTGVLGPHLEQQLKPSGLTLRSARTCMRPPSGISTMRP